MFSAQTSIRWNILILAIAIALLFHASMIFLLQHHTSTFVLQTSHNNSYSFETLDQLIAEKNHRDEQLAHTFSKITPTPKQSSTPILPALNLETITYKPLLQSSKSFNPDKIDISSITLNLENSSKSKSLSTYLFSQIHTLQQPELVSKVEKPSNTPFSEPFDISIYPILSDSHMITYKVNLTCNMAHGFNPIEGHYMFFIDLTTFDNHNSITALKEAIIRNLNGLHPKDLFSISVFNGKKLSQLPPTSFSEKSIPDIESLLNQRCYQSNKPFFLLSKLLPSSFEPHKHYALIWITGSPVSLDAMELRSCIHSWNTASKSQVTVYPFVLNHPKSPQQELLAELLQSTITYGSTPSLAEDLYSLLHQINNPVMKDIYLTPLGEADDFSAKITAIPGTSNVIYPHQEYQFYLTLKNTDPFYLFIQGRDGKTNLDFKKRIAPPSKEKMTSASHSEVQFIQKQHVIEQLRQTKSDQQFREMYDKALTRLYSQDL